MPDVKLELSKGLNTAVGEPVLPPGFLWRASGIVYHPDNETSPFKIPGREQAVELSGFSNPLGLAALQFDDASDRMLLLVDGMLVEQPLARTLGAWSEVMDKTPAPFPRSGTFLKAIHDGFNRWIAFTGAENERPLITDEDGNWRHLGLKKPLPLELASKLTAAASPIYPSDALTTAPGTSPYGTVTGSFANTSRAVDGNDATASSATVNAPGVFVTEWTFPTRGVAPTVTTGWRVYAYVNTSSIFILPGNDDGGTTTGTTSEPVVAALKVDISTDGKVSWTNLLSSSVPMGATTISYDLPAALDWSVVSVRVSLVYTSGTIQVIGNVFDVWAQSVASGGSVQVQTGTYYYSVTEVFKVTLASGKTFYTESAPSDPFAVSVSTADGTVYGIKLNLPTAANQSADGIEDNGTTLLHHRRIYRSTAQGTWPDLGWLGVELPVTDTTWTDNFDFDGVTLGSPSIYTVNVGSFFTNAAGQPPAFIDACVFKGCIVAIPVDDQHSIAWSLPAMPDYWPSGLHRLSLVGSDSNDKLVAVATVNDVLLVFTRNRVIRLRELPLANTNNYDISAVQFDTITQTAGCVGGPRAVTLAQSQKGHALLVWVSDSGLWMTDGSLVTERGMGTVKLSVLLDWEQTVERSRLSEAKLTYDQTYQIVWFDYYGRSSGQLESLSLHFSPKHWVNTGEDAAVPKTTGPHNLRFVDRAVGYLGVLPWQWTLTPTHVYNEGQGTSDMADFSGADERIITHVETGWIYPDEANGDIMVRAGMLYHSDWGPQESCDIDVLTRRDLTGSVAAAHKRAIPLVGARVSRFWVNSSGNSMKIILKHVGRTVAPWDGNFGPLLIDIDSFGKMERD